jgi:hypothetical protein
MKDMLVEMIVSAYLAKSRDFQDTCARHLAFGINHPRDYELLYGRGWMERVTADAQASEINDTPPISCAPVSMKARPLTSRIRS